MAQMRTNSFGASLLKSWVNKLLFLAAIAPCMPLLFLENARPWGKYVFLQYAYTVAIALSLTLNGRKAKIATPARSMILSSFLVHMGFMLVVLVGQYLWLALFPYLPDFLAAKSGRGSLYVLIGLLALMPVWMCEKGLLKRFHLKKTLQNVRNSRRLASQHTLRRGN